MNKELCKKLKDAGFPQEYRKSDPLMDFAYAPQEEVSGRNEELHMLHSDNDTCWWIGNDYNHSEMTDDEMKKDWVKCPTLSELIEAVTKDCKTWFRIHFYSQCSDKSQCWQARYGNHEDLGLSQISCWSPETKLLVITSDLISFDQFYAFGIVSFVPEGIFRVLFYSPPRRGALFYKGNLT